MLQGPRDSGTCWLRFLHLSRVTVRRESGLKGELNVPSLALYMHEGMRRRVAAERGYGGCAARARSCAVGVLGRAAPAAPSRIATNAPPGGAALHAASAAAGAERTPRP